jgi:hypothetical protein
MTYGDIKRLSTEGQQLTTDTTPIYTAPSGKLAQIGSIIFHNSDTVAREVNVFSNTNANSGRILSIALPASETYEFSPKIPIVLNGDETLQANSSFNTVVNTFLYGREEI